ncbi:MFS transporter [Bacillus carboniphilus]|uniref:MFS transporter n=1 Tax=Bacillus carboniphilus TaxID=86663 RepID=A0ABY9JTH7_9BACI|nr:MFS transporter [Bacillus carboniphilus]WLR42053.1 MFS transporter [Bacillus carboniphilus]
MLSLPAGVWVEKRSKKKIALTAELVRTITMTLLVFVILFDEFNILIICSILFISGMAGLFFKISLNSITPQIAGRDRLIEAHNYLEGADAVSTLVGPLLAGLMLSTIGAAATLGIDALTFLLSFLSICALRFIEKEPINQAELKEKSSLKEGLAGINLLFSTKIHRFISFNHTVLNFTTHAVVLLVVITAKQHLQLSPTQTGILLSGAGIWRSIHHDCRWTTSVMDHVIIISCLLHYYGFSQRYRRAFITD